MQEELQEERNSCKKQLMDKLERGLLEDPDLVWSMFHGMAMQVDHLHDQIHELKGKMERMQNGTRAYH